MVLRALMMPLLIAWTVAGPHGPTAHGAARLVAGDDAEVLAALDRINGDEIAAATLAATSASSGVVKAMARRIQDDHTRSRARIQALAQKLSLSVPAGTKSTGPSDLASKKGSAFDQAFIDHEIGSHQQAIEQMSQTLQGGAGNAEVKTLVEETMSLLQAHLDLARAAKDQLAAS